MKKISAIILLLTLALSLFACGGEKQESSPAAGESSAAAGESSAAAGESSEEESSAAAGESSEEESSSAAEAHTHEFGEWKQTKEATYTEAGVETRECACGEKELVEIPALGKEPQTGDSSNLTLWIVIMAVAVVGAAVALFFLLKKRKSNKD